MSFQHLVFLRALVVEKSVSKAARRMNVSQSSMSSALARLRRAFGDPILTRRGNSSEPTPLAMHIATHTEGILRATPRLATFHTAFHMESGESPI